MHVTEENSFARSSSAAVLLTEATPSPSPSASLSISLLTLFLTMSRKISLHPLSLSRECERADGRRILPPPHSAKAPLRTISRKISSHPLPLSHTRMRAQANKRRILSPPHSTSASLSLSPSSLLPPHLTILRHSSLPLSSLFSLTHGRIILEENFFCDS